MAIEKSYLNKFIKATEKAAIGAYPFIGKADKIAADQGSVDYMRNELNKIEMDGEVVIGEGEMDETLEKGRLAHSNLIDARSSPTPI